MPAYTECSDLELVLLLRRGDHAAYTEIFERFYGLLFVHAYKMLHNEDEAKDVVQELFEVLWTRREAIELNGSVPSYLYAAIRNRILNFIAHKGVEARYISSLGDFIAQDNFLPDHYVREREMKKLIEREIAALPVKMRRIFELSRKENLSHKEIAVQLDISEQTVRTQIKRALRILRPRLSTIAFLMLGNLF